MREKGKILKSRKFKSRKEMLNFFKKIKESK